MDTSVQNNVHQLHWHNASNKEGTDQEAWNNGSVVSGAVQKLCEGGKAIISPTNVGYIIMTTDPLGLSKKFDMKNRPLRKPGVVLAKDDTHAAYLAQMSDKVRAFYQEAYKRNILLGCILPWKNDKYQELVPEDARSMVSDARGTSCFVIRYGTPSEAIAHQMWERHGKLCFASSANPSGKGNRGKLEGVGERILGMADLIIEGDEFVAAQQPDTDEGTRMEQGVMVSFVDMDGQFSDVPVIIRNGLHKKEIQALAIEIFGFCVNYHGSYY
jgi:tRNA A37 threonylcarbamoyladenosine synthetase subunit TsaC/SUA5/YrdC